VKGFFVSIVGLKYKSCEDL